MHNRVYTKCPVYVYDINDAFPRAGIKPALRIGRIFLFRKAVGNFQRDGDHAGLLLQNCRLLFSWTSVWCIKNKIFVEADFRSATCDVNAAFPRSEINSALRNKGCCFVRRHRNRIFSYRRTFVSPVCASYAKAAA